MYDDGLVEEVERLLDLGLERGQTASRAIGYREAAPSSAARSAATRRSSRRRPRPGGSPGARTAGSARTRASSGCASTTRTGWRKRSPPSPPRLGGARQIGLRRARWRHLTSREVAHASHPCAHRRCSHIHPRRRPARRRATGPGARRRRTARPAPPRKTPTAIGKGGAVSTVDPEASAAALKVLKQGGNAADAAVAAAATLGVTEPYSAGIGGGGYFVFYDAKTGKVSTIDGRETAPKKMPNDAFIDPATGEPYNFTPELVTSGVSVGTPGTAGDLGPGAEEVRHALAGRRAQAGDQGRDPRLQGRRDVPRADPRQRGALPRLPGHQEAVPARRATPPRSARSSPTPSSPRPTPTSASAASRPSTRATSPS